MIQSPSISQITVVVASHKRPRAVLNLLLSLQRQTLHPSQLDVSVVVDGIDETEEQYQAVLEGFRSGGMSLDYHFQLNEGQSTARHRAILAARTPWICVVDDDMELVPRFLASHLALLQAGTQQTIVIGRVVPEENWEQAPLYEAVRTSHMLEWHDILGQRLKAPWGQTFVTQNVSFGREFYLAVGGFDEQLRLGEDSELGLRFEIAGGQFVFSDEAAAIHRSRVGSYDAWLRRSVEYGKVGVYVYEKLGRDARAHPLRNLVNGSRLNAISVHALCWSDRLTGAGIAALKWIGNVLRPFGLVTPAIATHKAILALAYHLGVKSAWGSWRRVLEEKHVVASSANREPT
jgi:GT2 family glycosyltransferase